MINQEHDSKFVCCFVLAAGEQRLDDLLHGRPLFRGMWENGLVPDAIYSKLEVLEGDISVADCGLSQRQLARLRAEVDWVIHSAASISFFDHIHTLLDQNYLVRHTFLLARGSTSAQKLQVTTAVWATPPCRF